ncbi:MAG: serine protease [Alphaproteobacteria bacterium]|nr:serine protease [Alphaproteobacteria bacterium]
MSLVDPYSTATLPIQIFFDEELLGAATGFLWNAESGVYLISNWHVFSGRDPNNDQPKHRDGALPNRIVVLCNSAIFPHVVFPISLMLDDENGNAKWFEHPTFGRRVDVAALQFIETSPFIVGLTCQPPVLAAPINNLPAVSDAVVAIGQDVFVIGFPLGIRQKANIPIWKRASIASEISLNYNKLTLFLIDTATREGMSGAPVFWRGYGSYRSRTSIMTVSDGPMSMFMGVYSGRNIGKSLGDAQLGIVWRPECVSEIVLGQKLGSNRML